MGEKVSESFKIYSYSGRPDQVVQAVELGFDIFTGSFPYLLTQENHACMYEYKMTANEKSVESDEETEGPEVPIKRQKLSESVEKTKETFIDLKDQKYYSLISNFFKVSL